MIILRKTIYSLVTVIEGEPSGMKTNGPVPWSGLHNTVVERTPGKKCEQGIKHQRLH
ncbi:MAG TPA: hypothetical protein VFK25_03650 [Candidatus Binatia bacterium]|nr:hypothetical protein [Candidatus Binatia bacterium]